MSQYTKEHLQKLVGKTLEVKESGFGFVEDDVGKKVLVKSVGEYYDDPGLVVEAVAGEVYSTLSHGNCFGSRGVVGGESFQLITKELDNMPDENAFDAFKAGDTIIFGAEGDSYDITVGKEYLVRVDGEDELYLIDDAGDRNYCITDTSEWLEQYQIKVVDRQEVQQAITPLNTRKTGKIRMELVETGFPNALLAIGSVMTWASENKGYGDGDWVKISNPDMVFLGAASRHRLKRLAGNEFDEESGLLHLQHEAFNVLAELEMALLAKKNKE